MVKTEVLLFHYMKRSQYRNKFTLLQGYSDALVLHVTL